MWKRMFRGAHTSRPGRQRPSRRVPLVELTGLELLDRRVLPAVTATFSAAQGVLTVMGDDLDNSIAVTRDAAGTLLVNGARHRNGPGRAGHRRQYQADPDLRHGRQRRFGLVSLGELAPALVNGGAGNDTITSGTGNDTLVGGAGDDIYRLDTDTALGSDTIDESGGGIDTLDFSSTTTRAVSINLGNPAAQVVNAGLTLTLSAGNTIENVIGGALINPTGSQMDQLFGNGLNNVIVGGDGNDFIDGGAGNDTLAGAPATTSSAGTRATAATPSTARTASTTSWGSPAPT